MAGIYLLYGSVVFFGSLGSQSHSWWPIFFYPVIWPLSLVFRVAYSRLAHAVFSPGTPSWAFLVYDYFWGFIYIVVGTIWVWWLGRLFSTLATRIFPFRDEKHVV